MAKKKETKVEVQTPQEETVVMEQPVVKAPKVEAEPKKNKWEIKDRTYFLKGKSRPLSRSLKGSDIYYFDEEAGFERELKYCENQRTSFVDEMKGDHRLSHIVFRNGVLHVEKNKVTLQKLLSLYHPDLNNIYYEHKPKVRAQNHLEILEMQTDALVSARDVSIDVAEAILRVELGSRVTKMSSKELRRDLLLFAKRNPVLLLELLADDNVMLRNFGVNAVEANIIKLSDDQRYFVWGSSGKKLMTVPFDEHPYSALAQWFKTDEGMEVYSNIDKRLKL